MICPVCGAHIDREYIDGDSTAPGAIDQIALPVACPNGHRPGAMEWREAVEWADLYGGQAFAERDVPMFGYSPFWGAAVVACALTMIGAIFVLLGELGAVNMVFGCGLGSLVTLALAIADERVATVPAAPSEGFRHG